jgi:phosphoenolpyruvate carboxykinase (GTP)
MTCQTENEQLNNWIKEVSTLCKPDSIQIVLGDEDEMQAIEKTLVDAGTFIPLNPLLRPRSFLARSNPLDVARVEERTYICSENETDAGPTNNWKAPREMKKHLSELFEGCMRGRTMYVVPYCMGPIGSPFSKVAIEITDSPYVVANMAIMTHMGKKALELLGTGSFVKCLHSVGKCKDKESVWPCDPYNTAVCHFPETGEVWSYGSGYGGNALLSKKSFSLRIASAMAKNEGWLAEHMLILGITNPEGEKRYFAAAFPSACGKTNLAMMTSNFPGWKVECVGDDIAWMHWGKDGKLYAINPEAGFFGVAPGTSMKSNPNAMRSIEKNTIFTNVALTDDGDVWWEQMTQEPPKHLINWLGRDWTPDSAEKAAHPNSRFTVSASQCPTIDPRWQDPMGVPISGIIFGGRRGSAVPLVRQALSWTHGVFLGASMSSETTAAAAGELGRIRHDPFAMLPFCGYNMADYFSHWLSMEQKGRVLPEIFYVNWFRKDHGGRFLWPGFGQNLRVLKWCFERICGHAGAVTTPIGFIPESSDLDLSGLDITEEAMDELLQVDTAAWHKESEGLALYFKQFHETTGDKFPKAFQEETARLVEAFKAYGA